MNIVGQPCTMKGSKFAIPLTLQTPSLGRRTSPDPPLTFACGVLRRSWRGNLDLIQTPLSSCFLFVFSFLSLAHVVRTPLGREGDVIWSGVDCVGSMGFQLLSRSLELSGTHVCRFLNACVNELACWDDANLNADIHYSFLYFTNETVKALGPHSSNSLRCSNIEEMFSLSRFHSLKTVNL
jgi:hypothetical protein